MRARQGARPPQPPHADTAHTDTAHTDAAHADTPQLRRAAVAVAVRIAAAIALMVMVVIAAAALYMLYLSHHPHVPASDTSARVYVESNDMLKAMAVAGVAGILAAGVIGWLSARSAIRPLGRALAVQRRFIQDASHELRTPLTILDTRVQLAAAKVAPDTEAARLLGQIRQDTAALSATVTELLLAATGGGAPAVPVDVDAVVADVLAGLDGVAAARRVRLQGMYDGGARVSIEPNSLRRAVLALVDNALNHTPAGGSVTATVRRSGRLVEVEVADTGTGITGIDPARIFDRFAHSGDAVGGRRSYGLGLALVREIAAAAGGGIEVGGTGPAGTLMRLSLPACQ